MGMMKELYIEIYDKAEELGAKVIGNVATFNSGEAALDFMYWLETKQLKGEIVSISIGFDIKEVRNG